MGNEALQLRKHIELLDRVIAKKEEMIEGITSAIEEYMEGVDMSEAMLDMVDAEISLRGKASRRTVYGIIGRRWVSQRNKGLTSYLYQKIVATKKMIDLIAKYRYESNIEEKDIETIYKEDESLKSTNSRLKNKIERFADDVRKLSIKGAEEEEKAIKLTEKEIRILNHILRYEIIEYHLARRLTFFFFAPYAEKKLTRYIKKEQRFFRRFLRRELNVTNDEMKDLKLMLQLIKEGNRLLKILHTKRVRGKKVIVSGLHEFRIIKKSLRRAKRIQRKLRKIKEYGAKYGIKLSKTIIKTSGEINELERTLSSEVNELDEITVEFQQLTSLIDIIKKFEVNMLNTELALSPKILWINETISKNIKHIKKGGEGTEKLFGSISNIVERTVLPIVKARENERNTFAEYLLSDEMIIKKIEEEIKNINELDKKFNDTTSKVGSNIVRLERAVSKSKKKSLNKIKRAIRKQKILLRMLRIFRRKHADVSRIKQEIKRLKIELKKKKKKYHELEKELKPETKAMMEALNNFPLISKELEPIMQSLSDLKMAVSEINKESEFSEAGILAEWISNPTNISIYTEFLDTMFKSLDDDKKVIDELTKFSQALINFENEFEKYINILDEQIKKTEEHTSKVDGVISKYASILGSNVNNLFVKITEVVQRFPQLLQESRMVLSRVKELRGKLYGIETIQMEMDRAIIESRKEIKRSIKDARRIEKRVSRILKRRENQMAAPS